MTMAAMQIILFGDQIADLRVALRRINQRKGNSVLLWSFLEKLNAALREEVGEQPQWIKDQIPEFTTVFELAERYYETDVPNPMIAGALLCACQLATLIKYAPSIDLHIIANMIIAILKRSQMFI